MSWYKDYGAQWKDIIAVVANAYSRTELMVEKDVVQSLFLCELSKNGLPFVFKGGTSLSKAYGLIDRFSEDIDLSASRKLTESERRSVKGLIIRTADNLGLILKNPEEIQSRHSYNCYEFAFDSLFGEAPQGLVVETSFYQNVYPSEIHKVDSFVGRFCREKSVKMPFTFEAAKFEMPVQSLERTFVDKVFAVCDYRLQNMMDRDSRHLYDIAKLVPQIAFSRELEHLIDEVRADRMKMENNPSAQPEHNIPQMLSEIIDSRFYEDDYNRITMPLLYEKISYNDAIANGIAKIAGKPLFAYRDMTEMELAPEEEEETESEELIPIL